MTQINIGGFLAPHHPIGESPMLQFQRDLDLVAHMDRLGFSEFWCGEHHSTGWEVIASPEMFLAAAAQRSHRIKLGTGVVSLPYHHPFHVAQRMVQLDHMSQGRAIFGSGPGALPSDAHMLGLDPMVLRDRQDEAIGVVRRLLNGERVSHNSEWFTLQDAALQLLPVQRDLPFAVASMVSPSGMTLAGKHGTGVLSIGSMSTAGLDALPLQWSFAEDAAAESGAQIDRSNWRIVMSFHIAETRELAREQAKHGLHRWHNEYTVGTLMRPGAVAYDSPDEAVDAVAEAGTAGASVVGTPDDMIASVRRLQEITGGFGTVIGFIHDWANPENTMNSWDMVARYVLPELNGQLDAYRASQRHVIDNRAVFDRAGEAITSKIMANEKAAKALAEGAGQDEGGTAVPTHHTPDLRG